jgi:excisionase family DNA binding protein
MSKKPEKPKKPKKTKKPLTAAQLAARAAAREAKRKGSQMASPEELSEALGVGLNQAYSALAEKKIPAVRVGRRWLISRKTIDRIVNGEFVPTTA